MLTIFTIPKPFKGDIGIIQRNAISSWAALAPACEIIIFGDDYGVKEAAREFKARYQPDIRKNEYGTPFLDDVFAKAEKSAEGDMFCYVNCDIILMDDFSRAVSMLKGRRRPFLMAGVRRNLVLGRPLDFSAGWQADLRRLAMEKGSLEPPTGIDYFIFKKGLWDFILPFAIGRTAWDNWLVYKARQRKAAVIDATAAVMAVHQAHEDRRHGAQKDSIYKAEADYNWALAGGMRHLFMMHDATHVLTAGGIRPALQWRYLKSRLWRMAAPAVYSLFARRIRGFFPWRIKK